MLRSIFFALLFCGLASPLNASWDAEYWQYWNYTNWKREPFKLYTVGEARLNREMSKIYFVRLAGNFAYSPLPFLDLEAHYSYLYEKPRGAQHFSVKSRYEFEVNPKYTFDNGIQLKWRNRYELIKKQAIKKLTSIFRHRTMIVFPIENWGRIKRISVSDEVFYDYSAAMFSQNRFAPLIVNFDLGKESSVDVFLQIRNFYSRGVWYRSFDIVSQIIF